MQKLIFTLLLFTAFTICKSQTQFWSDTFEDVGAPSSGSRTPTQNFSCGGPPSTAYFFRTNTSGIALQAGSYSGMQGAKFWAGEDIDYGSSCTNSSISPSQQITWSGINIFGKTGLSFRGLFAANGVSTGNWEGTAAGAVQDFIIVEYQIDGGGWFKTIQFASPLSTPAQQTLNQDANFDGLGEGIALGYSFQEFTTNISGTGTTLDLRLTMSSNNSLQEEMAIDNFRLFETVGCTNPTIGTQPTNKSVCFNTNTSFSIAATGAGSYQWQENSGSGFTNITNGGIYSGATTAVLNLTGITSQSGYLYRCIAIGTGTCQTISNSATLTVSAYFNTSSQTNVSCNGGNNGSATLNAAGGISPYSYSWAPSGGTSATATGLSAGTYTVNVTDAISCSTTKTFTITQPAALIVNPLSQTNIACFGGSTGAASVSASGGTTAYSYNWTPGNPTGDGTASVTGLTAGTWSCTVTDANSCTRTQTFNITQPASALSASNVVTNVLCFGASTGAINLTPAGGTAPYTFNWGGGITTEDRTGLLAGTYNCTVTDNNGCTTTSGVTITQPATSVSASNVATNVLCNGAATGAINLTPAGGTAPYTFNWGGGIITEDRTGLLAGTYNCTVTDNNGCTTTSNATITQPVSALATATAVANISCFGGANGSATVTATGGTSSYTYLWSTGATTSVITSQSLGTKSYTVTDANGCASTGNVVISQPTQISATIGSNPTSCTGNTGSAAITSPAGGAGGYTYSWAPSGGTASTATALGVGSYTCTITDANSCSITKTVSVITASGPSLTSLAQTNVACFGNSTGAASVNNATGGAGGYTYNWTPGNPTGDGTTSVTGLTAGSWSCTVTDANGCSAFQAFNITQPASALATSTAVTNVACFGNSTGAATVTATGGTSAYTYLWSTGATTSVITSQASGTKSYTVTDANGCTSNGSVTISQPASALATTTAVTNIACFGNSTGAATVTASGGTSAYTYLWSTGATTSVIASQTSGVKTVTVTDANGCTSIKSVSISQPASALATSTAVSNVVCFGNSTGAATVTTTGGTSAYTYLWSTGATTSVITTQSSGTKSYTVTDANGCTNSGNAIISQPASALATSTIVSNVLCNGGSTGSATVTATGGTSAYSYLWSTGATTSVITSQTSGIKTVTVTDANGCTSVNSVNISQPTLLTATNSQTNTTCNGVCNGVANVSVSGGTSPYTYNWSNSSTTASQNSLCAGSYSVTITDANGCSIIQTITITEPTAITVSATSGNILCNGGSATLTITASGGTGAFTGTGTYTQATGSNTYTVNDANGCSASTVITISEPTALTVNLSAAPIACNGSTTQVNITANGGTSPYTGTTPVVVSAGTYSYTVTDNNGCAVTETISISEPAAIVASQTITLCNGQSITIGANTYTASGIYVDVLQSQVNGCDSTLTTDLTISPAITHTQNITLCFGEIINVGANTYNTSGTFVDVLTAVNGCDSTLTTILVVNPAIDVTTNLTGLTISANESSATYQWIDCDNSNQPIAGETNQSFTASSNGNYAVIVTQNSCSDTSACVNINTVGIKDVTKSNTVNIYPNPSNGIFTISIIEQNTNISIFNSTGKLVKSIKLTDNDTTIDLTSESRGIYFVKIKSDKGDSIQKLIKQ